MEFQSIGMDLEWLNVGFLSKTRNQSHSESNPIHGCVDVALLKKARNRIAMLIYPADSFSVVKLIELDDRKILTGNPYI
jgi:hypothetical protein